MINNEYQKQVKEYMRQLNDDEITTIDYNDAVNNLDDDYENSAITTNLQCIINDERY